MYSKMKAERFQGSDEQMVEDMACTTIATHVCSTNCKDLQSLHRLQEHEYGALGNETPLSIFIRHLAFFVFHANQATFICYIATHVSI